MSPETELVPNVPPRSSLFRRHHRKLVAPALWAAAILGYQVYAWRSGLTPLEAAGELADLASAGAVGGLVLVGVFAAATLILFPPTLLTVAAGFVFGPAEGVLFAALGSNLAASVSYLMGRRFGRGSRIPGTPSGRVGRYAGWMKANGFEAVLLMRLAYAPFDPVGLLAGFLRVDWRRFALATALGSLPCTLSLVLLGSSLQAGLRGTTFAPDRWALLASAVLFFGTIVVSRYLKHGPTCSEDSG